jgi:hypothetical protein
VVGGCHWVGEDAGWWWCHGVMVLGERTCGGVRSVDIEKRYKKKLIFFSLIIQTPHKPWNTPRTGIMQR